jgi:hypothetical protein
MQRWLPVARRSGALQVTPTEALEKIREEARVFEACPCGAIDCRDRKNLTASRLVLAEAIAKACSETGCLCDEPELENCPMHELERQLVRAAGGETAR